MACSRVREAAAVFSITALAGIPFYLFLVEGCGLRFNLTLSAPVGVYEVSRNGSYLGFCPEGEAAKLSAERGYRSRSLFACPDGRAELIKPIATHPRDVVTVSAAGIEVNGRLLPESAPQTADRAGRPMTAYPSGIYQATERQMWVVSQHAFGFDSRYYGPVERGEHLRFVFGW
jgi:conjugative transfer signal peptidase TraF